MKTCEKPRCALFDQPLDSSERASGVYGRASDCIPHPVPCHSHGQHNKPSRCRSLVCGSSFPPRFSVPNANRMPFSPYVIHPRRRRGFQKQGLQGLLPTWSGQLSLEGRLREKDSETPWSSQAGWGCSVIPNFGRPSSQRLPHRCLRLPAYFQSKEYDQPSY